MPPVREKLIYHWSVRDHRMGNSWHGQEPQLIQAQTRAILEVKTLGRRLRGVSCTVFKPGGGGWFLREAIGNGWSWEPWSVDAPAPTQKRGRPPK